MEKRRNSFVDHKRKSLTFTNIFIDDTQEELKVQEKPRHSIKSYCESLKREKQEWKSILREKKIKLKDYSNLQKSAPLVITREKVEKFFTSEDKEFLENKPNYLEMVQLVKKCVDAVNYLNKYKSDIIDYYSKVCNELEIEKKILVEKMCANDLCEICNIKDCQRQEHKFVI